MRDEKSYLLGEQVCQKSLFSHGKEYSDRGWLVSVFDAGQTIKGYPLGHAAIFVEGILDRKEWRETNLLECIAIESKDELVQFYGQYDLVVHFDSMSILERTFKTIPMSNIEIRKHEGTEPPFAREKYRRSQCATYYYPITDSEKKDRFYQMVKSIHGDHKACLDSMFILDEHNDEEEFNFKLWPISLPLNGSSNEHNVNCAIWANKKMAILGLEKFGKKMYKPKNVSSLGACPCRLT